MRIPTALEKQPVIDAAFEVRYSKNTQISEIIPGFLFHRLGCNQPIESLPASQIPKNLRDNDEKLHYAPIFRLSIDGYYIAISDHGVVISSKGKYQGWSAFRNIVLSTLEKIDELKLNTNITRYSLKYIDFFPDTEGKPLLPKLNIQFKMGDEELISQPLTLRTEKEKDGYKNIIQVVTHALVHSELISQKSQGLILDIDTINIVQSPVALNSFNSDRISHLDKLHTCNKEIFFQCLKDETIQLLGPKY